MSRPVHRSRPVLHRLDDRLTPVIGWCGTGDLPHEPPAAPVSAGPPAPAQGAARVAGDLDRDGAADLIQVDGPRVAVRGGAGGAVLVPAFAPFEAAYTGTLNAVLADLDGDGRCELVVAPDAGGGPVVAVYDAAGRQLARFFGIDDPAFRGGARLAAGIIGGGAGADLVATAGAGGGPRVAVFDGGSLAAGPRKPVGDFFAFEAGQRGGAYPLVEDLGLDGTPDLLFGAGPGGGPRVRAVSFPGLTAGGPVRSLDEVRPEFRLDDRFVGDPDARDGLRLSVRRADPAGTGSPEVVGDPGTGEPELIASLVRVYVPPVPPEVAEPRAGG